MKREVGQRVHTHNHHQHLHQLKYKAWRDPRQILTLTFLLDFSICFFLSTIALE